MNSAKHIADRIRLMIATKQFQVDELLPSTRTLGKQLQVSFHTVRKAYQALADEGLLRGEKGRGFVVSRQNTSLNKAERLEKGAGKMRVLLEELIGYGLDEEEVETLFDEQLSFLEWPERLQSCATIGATGEHGSMIGDAINNQVGVKSGSLPASSIDDAVNFDALFVPVRYLNDFRKAHETLTVLPLVHSLDPEMQVEIAESQSLSSIGIVTAEEQTISILVNEIKNTLNFPGSLIGGAIYGRSLPLFVRDVDLVMYTKGSAALVEKQIPAKRRMKLRYHIAEQSAALIRAELWDQ